MGSITVIQNPALNTTNVAASSYDEWVVGTAYTTGQRVKVSTESDGTTPRFPVREYQANGATTGNYPPTAAVSHWVEVGAQNAHAMFDLLTDQRTFADTGETIDVTLSPSSSAFDRIALLGIAGTNLITIEVISEASVVYSATAKMVEYSTPVGWWTYLFRSDQYAYRRSAVFDINSKFINPTVRVVLDGPAPECGWCMLGSKYNLGPTDWEAEANPKDYSAFRTNEFGVTTFIPRRVVDDVRGTLWVNTPDYNRVYSILRKNMNTLALYDLNNTSVSQQTFDSLIVYGKLESVSGGLSYGKTPINIKISGLT